MTSIVCVDRSVGEYFYSPHSVPRASVASGTTILIETRDPRSGAILIGAPGSFQAYPPPPAGKTNALTGPVGIFGAELGDVVSIDVLSISLAEKGYMAAGDFGWVVPLGRIGDRSIGIVGCRNGYVYWRNGMRFPARPMIGEMGMASHTEPKSGSIGANGGNFDCSLISPGCRVYIPVFVAEALLYVGDVHASMGDGELSCGGVEIAADVVLQVKLIKKMPLRAPRLETPDRIVTLGWGREFAEARAMVVEEMIGIMEASMRVSAVEALMLISATGDLRIGQACGNMDMTVRLEMPRLPGLTVLPEQTTR